MIDVVSGTMSQGKDWSKIWLESPEYEHTVKELDSIISEAASKEPGTVDDGFEFATPMWTQLKLVTRRMNIAIYRNTDYINNKNALHIGSALFNGFTFWMVGNGVGDLQLRLFTIFNFIFVAPGVIAQLQPLFIDRRDIYEAREKKSKMYSWVAFVTGLIISELPYLCVCAVLYFVCWYYTVGFSTDSNKAGAVFFVMLCYEFMYTGIGQVRTSVRYEMHLLIIYSSSPPTHQMPSSHLLSTPSSSEPSSHSAVFLYLILRSPYFGGNGCTGLILLTT